VVKVLVTPRKLRYVEPG